MYEVGCYGDGSLGNDHVTRRLFDIALSEGWKPTEKCILFIEDFPPDCMSMNEEDMAMTSIYVQELENEAMDFLNSHCREENHHWTFIDGDLLYTQIYEDD